MNVTVRALFVLILAACAVGIIAVGVSLVVPDAGKSSRHTIISDKHALYPCEHEDEDNCYWDAQTMGNGLGSDSVVITP